MLRSNRLALAIRVSPLKIPAREFDSSPLVRVAIFNIDRRHWISSRSSLNRRYRVHERFV